MAATPNERRTGADTRAEILRVAMDLFIEKGFEGTSTRDIATAVGITKSSLYHHFRNKDDIALHLSERRLRDVEELLEWVAEQPRDASLLQATALRWVETTTEETLQAMRLAHANQPAVRRMEATGHDVRSGIEQVVQLFVADDAPASHRLMVRMAFNSVASALLSAYGAPVTVADIITAARANTIALTNTLGGRT